MKKSLIQKLGLLGIISFLSYTAAVIFAPLVYPFSSRKRKYENKERSMDHESPCNYRSPGTAGRLQDQ